MIRFNPDFEHHLQETREAVRAWLEHEDKMSFGADATNPDVATYRAMILEGYTDPPEQPEVLKILRKTRRFGLSMWPGGYADQPHILLMELNVTIDEEIQYQNLALLNKALSNAHQNTDQGTLD